MHEVFEQFFNSFLLVVWTCKTLLWYKSLSIFILTTLTSFRIIYKNINLGISNHHAIFDKHKLYITDYVYLMYSQVLDIATSSDIAQMITLYIVPSIDLWE